MEANNYPECEKLQKSANVHQTLNEFIEWLYDSGFYIKHYEKKGFVNRDTIVYDFMEVDTKKMETERRDMLKSLNQTP